MILVTGANGFIGRALRTELNARSIANRGATRTETPDSVAVGNIDGGTDWSTALADVDVVVHLAGRAHVMRDTAAEPLAEFRRVNVAGTLNLARQAADRGVNRFVFISSIKVNGEATRSTAPFGPDDIPAPADPYGISKYEAETGLREMASQAGFQLVIIRPVLVYGPGAKGNFPSLARLVSRGLPLPLGGIRNRRSLVALDNLIDLIALCLYHPAAANQTFLVSDGDDLSTPDLVRCLADATGATARLIAVPVPALKWVAGILGRRDAAIRLCDSLQVDIEKTRRLLDWSPPFDVRTAMKRAVRDEDRSA